MSFSSSYAKEVGDDDDDREEFSASISSCFAAPTIRSNYQFPPNFASEFQLGSTIIVIVIAIAIVIAIVIAIAIAIAIAIVYTDIIYAVTR